MIAQTPTPAPAPAPVITEEQKDTYFLHTCRLEEKDLETYKHLLIEKPKNKKEFYKQQNIFRFYNNILYKQIDNQEDQKTLEKKLSFDEIKNTEQYKAIEKNKAILEELQKDFDTLELKREHKRKIDLEKEKLKDFETLIVTFSNNNIELEKIFSKNIGEKTLKKINEIINKDFKKVKSTHTPNSPYNKIDLNIRKEYDFNEGKTITINSYINKYESKNDYINTYNRERIVRLYNIKSNYYSIIQEEIKKEIERKKHYITTLEKEYKNINKYIKQLNTIKKLIRDFKDISSLTRDTLKNNLSLSDYDFKLF